MVKAVVLYPNPTNSEEFELRYREEHRPLVQGRLPGLREFKVAKVVASPMGPAPFAYTAELTFDSLEAFQGAFGSAQGQSAIANALDISTGGPMTVLVLEEMG